VAVYLSVQWIAEAAEAVARHPGVQAQSSQPLVIEVITGDVAYHVVAANGRVELVGGRTTHPDVVFTQSVQVARAVARGETRAQEAFVTGALRISGRADALVAARPLLEAIDAALAPVRAATEF
jgi:putative sterol carrier protein